MGNPDFLDRNLRIFWEISGISGPKFAKLRIFEIEFCKNQENPKLSGMKFVNFEKFRKFQIEICKSNFAKKKRKTKNFERTFTP